MCVGGGGGRDGEEDRQEGIGAAVRWMKEEGEGGRSKGQVCCVDLSRHYGTPTSRSPPSLPPHRAHSRNGIVRGAGGIVQVRRVGA